MNAAADPAGVAAPDLDVIVVAHNAGELLSGCVSSVVAQVAAERVLVMDAESRDGAPDAVAAAHPGVRVVPVENRGFAAANNAGLRLTTGRYALLLNPDAVLSDGAVTALVACATTHPRAAVVGAKVRNPDGTLQAGQFGRFPSLAQAMGLRVWRLGQRFSGNTSMGPREPRGVKSVDWVTGACMLVRREAVDDVGMMDGGFFLYYEDTDWCHRMRDRGWDVLVEPSAEVVHHLGAAGADSDAVAGAYRESFYRYCDRYHLWGLKSAARLGLTVRASAGGRG